jgi:serine/threonine-protein kinase HipA
MGRRSRARGLAVWANGVRVATWRIPTRGDMELQYDLAWQNSAGGRPLSLSLPFGLDDSPLKGRAVASYFDNLLPDSIEIRRRLANRFRTGSMEPFDLLHAIGRDCAGAVQLLPEDEEPAGHDQVEGTPLSDAQIAAHLQGMLLPPPPGQAADDGFRISMAGAQEKTALLRHGNQWLMPHGATPTTHILKLPLGLVGNMQADLGASVENEWLCMQLLQAFGLPVANTTIEDFAGQRVLCVERFDRQVHSSGAWIMRLPQEDFCQVHGVPPTRKYEADGGPGVTDIARILASSQRAEQDVATLLRAQILFWMLAATDGHAKNFSIHLLPRGRFQLTPLYDVMSILPVMGDGPKQLSWHKAKLAMAVSGKNRHYLLKDIQRRHFNAMAPKCGHGDSAEALIEALLQRTAGAVAQVNAKLPAGFPQQVADKILGGLQAAAARLAEMPAI